MTEKALKHEQKNPAWHWILLLVFLAILAWCTRYWLSADFGLYEDDLTFIPDAIESDFPSIMATISGYFSTLAQQGRPLMWSWVVFFAYLGWNLGGMQGMFVIAYLVWLINITLFVFLLRKLNKNFLFCAMGGLAYVLFSADTNQAFLFNAYGLQTAITFLLIALHIYLLNSKWRLLSYLFILLVLLNYETPYWLFLAAPLLTQAKEKRLKKKLLLNTLVMVGLFLTIYVLRYFAGDSRVTGLGLPEMILTPLKHMIIGPFVGLGIYFLRPLLVLRNFSVHLGLAVLIGSAAIFTVLFWGLRNSPLSSVKLIPINKGWWADLTPEAKWELRLMMAGIVMLVFAYPLTIILRPYAISGRETRVHLAAVVGAALILATAITLVTRALRRDWLKIGFLVLVSLIFGFNFAFGFIIQKAYQRSWVLQKTFWREIIPLISDVQEGSAVLVEPSGMEDVLYINANTWILPRMLSRLYVLPEDWEREPSVFRLEKFWEENIVRIPGYFTIDGTNSFAHLISFGDYLQKETIFISTSGGGFTRLFEREFLDETVTLKPVGPDLLSTLETRLLYDLMILDD